MKEEQDRQKKKYKSWLRKFTKDLNKWKDISCIWIERLNIKMAILSQFSLTEDLQKLMNQS